MHDASWLKPALSRFGLALTLYRAVVVSCALPGGELLLLAGMGAGDCPLLSVMAAVDVSIRVVTMPTCSSSSSSALLDGQRDSIGSHSNRQLDCN